MSYLKNLLHNPRPGRVTPMLLSRTYIDFAPTCRFLVYFELILVNVFVIQPHLTSGPASTLTKGSMVKRAQLNTGSMLRTLEFLNTHLPSKGGNNE